MKRRTLSLLRLFVLGSLSLWLLAGCNNTTTRTQLTFQIAATPGLQAQVAALRVVVRSDAKNDQTQEFQASDLNWPVEIVVTPAGGNGSTDEVTLIVTAYDASRAVLAQKTVVAKFMPKKAHDVSVPLDMGADDAGIADAGADSATPGSGDDGGPGNPPPGGDAAVDAAGPPPATDGGPSGSTTCATPGSNISCDDGNPCNGTETCDPANSGASNDGCVKGANVVTCGAGTTCDHASGQCSACLANADGDGDGVTSISCGGLDCNDSDVSIAPGKPELCDGKDNDCDMVVDGVKADPSCASVAPTNGTATCVNTRCAPACNDPTFQITNNMCVAPPTTCPIVNPCAPGACVGGVGGAYTCTCPAGYRTGLATMSHCVKQGVAAVDIGFEATCAGMPLTRNFPAMSETFAFDAALYAACGLASITSGSVMAAAPKLIVPMATPTTENITMIEGLTKETALASAATAGGASTLVFSFSTAVTTLSFDLLGVSDTTLVSVVATSGTAAVPGGVLAPALSGMHLHYSQTVAAASAISSVTVTVTTVAPASNQFFIDELSFSVGGCGDKVIDMAGGETCDDGNGVQCDGCDNACAVNTPNTSCTP